MDRAFTGTSKRASAWAVAVVVLACVAAYGNTLANGFVLDDAYNVRDNQEIRSLANVPDMFRHAWGSTAEEAINRKKNAAYWRPLTSVTLALDHQLWGGGSAGFHFTNVVVHTAICVLLFLLFEVWLAATLPAMFGALLFALHPVHTEAVNLITNRSDLLATLSLVGALFVYDRARNQRLRDFVWLPLIFACGLASKATAVTLPGWIALVAVWRHTSAPVRSTAVLVRHLVPTLAPLAACLAGYFVIRSQLLGASASDFFHGLGAFERFASVMVIYLRYVKLLFVPWPLVHFYDWSILLPARSFEDPRALGGLALLALTGWVTLVLWRRERLAAVGLACWLLGLLPVSHLIAIRVGAAERFLYFPSVGLCVAAAVGFEWWLRRQRTLALSTIVGLCLLMAVGTVVRNTHWRSDVRLHEQAAVDYPHGLNVHVWLGRHYYGEGQLDRAVEELSIANRLLPGMPSTVSWLARALMDRGDHEQARAEIEAALRAHGPDAELLMLRERAMRGN